MAHDVNEAVDVVLVGAGIMSATLGALLKELDPGIKLELVDNKSNNVMNGIAFGQSSHVRYIKTKRSFDICYSIEENSHRTGEVQLQIEDIKPAE